MQEQQKYYAAHVASVGTPASLQNLVLYKLVVLKVITAILRNWRGFINIALEKPGCDSMSMFVVGYAYCGVVEVLVIGSCVFIVPCRLYWGL